MKPKLPPRKTLIKQLDALFALKIALRDKRLRHGLCPFHTQCVPATQTFHFITRGKHSVRWDDRNAVRACGGCNVRFEHEAGFIDQVFTWYKTTHGQEVWDKLIFDGNQRAGFSRTDLMELKEKMRAELAG